MHKLLTQTLFGIAWTAITILALTLGTPYNWPDNVHADYGVPFVWATHTTSTIAGPVDLWSVDTQNLALNLVVWMGMMIAVLTIMQLLLNKSSEKLEKQGRAANFPASPPAN